MTLIEKPPAVPGEPEEPTGPDASASASGQGDMRLRQTLPMPAQERVAESMANEVPRGPRALIRQFVRDYNLLRATKYGVGPLGVIFLLDLVQGFDSTIPTLLLPEIRAEFNVTLLQLVLLGQVFSVVAITGGPVIGWLTDRVRRTYLVGISAIASGIFSIGSSFAGNMVAFQAMRSLDGTIGESLGNIPTQSLLYDYYPIEARA